MSEMGKHTSKDWCHLCGTRSYNLVDIWYPSNSEHPNPTEPDNYIRICKSCIDKMKSIVSVIVNGENKNE